MKPTKKDGAQNDSKSITKNKTEKDSSGTIKHFFKNVPKQVVTEERNVCDVRQFYIQALKDKLKRHEFENENHENRTSENESQTSENVLNGEDGACASVSVTDSGDKTNVQNSCDRCDQLQKKYDELKKVHLKLTFHYTELDMKFKDLMKTSTNIVHSDIDDTSSTDGIFTSSELKHLEYIPLDKTKDSTFILQCLRFAYKENSSSLVNKTLKGTPEWTEFKEDGGDILHPGKDPLTPEKVARIKDLFIQRLSKCKINSVEYGDRVHQSKINKLFATGIKNVAKTQK